MCCQFVIGSLSEAHAYRTLLKHQTYHENRLGSVERFAGAATADAGGVRANCDAHVRRNRLTALGVSMLGM